MASKSAARRAWRVARVQIDPRCDYCLIVTFEDVEETHPQRATVDDIVPRSKGGPNTVSNWALACRMCNHVKGDKPGVLGHHVSRKAVMSRLRRAQIAEANRAAARMIGDETERKRRLASLPFTLYTPIPGVTDEAFR